MRYILFTKKLTNNITTDEYNELVALLRGMLEGGNQHKVIGMNFDDIAIRIVGIPTEENDQPYFSFDSDA